VVLLCGWQAYFFSKNRLTSHLVQQGGNCRLILRPDYVGIRRTRQAVYEVGLETLNQSQKSESAGCDKGNRRNVLDHPQHRANSHCGIVLAHISKGCRSPTVSREATLRSASVPTYSSPHRRRPALRLSSGVNQANRWTISGISCVVFDCFRSLQ
jgi:hypothetical protein